MSRWTVLFSSVIPASGTRQIDKTFIKGLLTIQDQEHFKTHNKRKLRQQYRKSRFSGDKTAPLAVSFHHTWAAILDVLENISDVGLPWEQRLHFRGMRHELIPRKCSLCSQGNVGPNRKLVPSTPRLSFLDGMIEAHPRPPPPLPPQRFRPEGEIPRRHSSNSRVY